MTPDRIAAFLTARAQRRRADTPSTPTRRRAAVKVSAALMALNSIRGHKHAIGGYACKFGVPSVRVGRREIVRPHAFDSALAGGRWFLLTDHRNAAEHGVRSLASMDARTLHVEADPLGLWFEASLPNDRDGAALMDRIRAGDVRGASIGSERSTGTMQAGALVLDQIDAWEISIVLAPFRPGRAGTFCKPNAEARRDRSCLMRLA